MEKERGKFPEEFSKGQKKLEDVFYGLGMGDEWVCRFLPGLVGWMFGLVLW